MYYQRQRNTGADEKRPRDVRGRFKGPVRQDQPMIAFSVAEGRMIWAFSAAEGR